MTKVYHEKIHISRSSVKQCTDLATENPSEGHFLHCSTYPVFSSEPHAVPCTSDHDRLMPGYLGVPSSSVGPKHHLCTTHSELAEEYLNL